MMKIILVPANRTVQYIEQSVNNVIMLKTYVSAIKKVYQALSAAQSELLLTVREVGGPRPLALRYLTDGHQLCSPVGHHPIELLIEETLNEHITYQSKPLDLRNQRIYCVKVGSTLPCANLHILTLHRQVSTASSMWPDKRIRRQILMLQNWWLSWPVSQRTCFTDLGSDDSQRRAT